jgi:hypothetical protein
MYKNYYFHIQLTENSPWIIEIATSLSHAMAGLDGNYDYTSEPYCYFRTDY